MEDGHVMPLYFKQPTRCSCEYCVTVEATPGEQGKPGLSGTKDHCVCAGCVCIGHSTTGGQHSYSVSFGKCRDMSPEGARWGEESWHGRINCGGKGNNDDEKEPDTQDASTQHSV